MNRRQALGLLASLAAANAWAGPTVSPLPEAGAGASAASVLLASPTAPAAMSTELLKTGLYLIRGGGGNSLLRFSANGLILVDGKAPGNYRALMSQVRRVSKISDLPVRVLALTDHQPIHAGNQAQFAAAGVVRIVQDRVRARLSATEGPTASVAPGAKPLPPIIGFDREYRLALGGVEVRLLHFGGGHSDGSTVVHFADLKVVAVGELFSSIGMPQLDLEAGGSLAAWRTTLAQVLALDFDAVVPSAGPPVGRSELEAFKARLDAAVA